MKHCLCFFLICCAAVSLSAEPADKNIESLLASFLPETERQQLLEEGAVFRSVYREAAIEPRFTPPFAVPEHFVNGWDKGVPTFLIEALYLHKKKEGSGTDVEAVSHILRSLSQLQGLQYYSSSRKKMRTLYEESYVIDDPQSKQRLQDPVDHPAGSFSVYALQKDLTFGENIYRYRFYSDTVSSGFVSTNISVLKYSVFKAVEPEHLQVSVSVTDLGDYLLIHALTRSMFTAPSFLRQRVQNSFRTRMEAVYKWLIAQYNAEKIR